MPRSHPEKQAFFIPLQIPLDTVKDICLITFVTVLVHASYLLNGFTWLDHRDIEQHRALVSLSNLFTAFFTPYADTGFYRPLVTMLHSLNFWVFGLNAPGFHVTNLLLHLGVAITAPYFIAAFFPLQKPEKLLIGIIVGVSTASWLPVGATSYRPELLVTLFLFLAVIWHAVTRQTEQIKPVPLLLTLLFCLAALLAKETAFFVLPVTILIWEVTKKKLPPRSQFLPLFLAEGAILLLYVSLRLQAVPTLWKVQGVALPLSETVATRLSSLGKSLWELLLPVKPPLSDATRVVSFNDPFAFGMLLLLIIGLVVFFRTKQLAMKQLVLLTVCLLLPAANLIPLPRFHSPHYTYMLVAVLAGWLILLLKGAKKRLVLPVLILWIVLQAAATFTAGPQFRDDKTLFTPEVARDPQFLEGQFYLGNYFAEHKAFTQAANAYEASLRTSPQFIAYNDRPAALINLATVRVRERRLPDALRLLSQAEKIAPADLGPGIRYREAIVASQLQKYEQVIALLDDPSLRYSSAEPYVILANAFHQEHRDAEAHATLEKAKQYARGTQQKAIDRLLRLLSQ